MTTCSLPLSASGFSENLQCPEEFIFLSFLDLHDVSQRGWEVRWIARVGKANHLKEARAPFIYGTLVRAPNLRCL